MKNGYIRIILTNILLTYQANPNEVNAEGKTGIMWSSLKQFWSFGLWQKSYIWRYNTMCEKIWSNCCCKLAQTFKSKTQKAKNQSIWHTIKIRECKKFCKNVKKLPTSSRNCIWKSFVPSSSKWEPPSPSLALVQRRNWNWVWTGLVSQHWGLASESNLQLLSSKVKKKKTNIFDLPQIIDVFLCRK